MRLHRRRDSGDDDGMGKGAKRQQQRARARQFRKRIPAPPTPKLNAASEGTGRRARRLAKRYTWEAVRTVEGTLVITGIGLASQATDVLMLSVWLVGAAAVAIFATWQDPGLSRRHRLLMTSVALFLFCALWGAGYWHMKKAQPQTPPTQALHGTLPGFAVYAIAKIHDIDAPRRKYVFEMRSTCTKASASLYMSASDHLALAITDDSGETYKLDAPVGDGGLPVGDVVVLSASLGIASNHTLIELSVDGKKIDSKSIPFPISFDSKGLRFESIGTYEGGDNGAFDLEEIGLFPSMLSEDDDRRISDNMIAYKAKGVPVFLRFNGINSGLKSNPTPCAKSAFSHG